MKKDNRKNKELEKKKKPFIPPKPEEEKKREIKKKDDRKKIPFMQVDRGGNILPISSRISSDSLKTQQK
jgi:hypothetical protein